jgi:very-short-patch-repair endonuclease
VTFAPDSKIAATAASQYGHVTWTQLLAAGWSESQVRRRVAAGLLVRVHPGVYRVAGAPITAHGAHLAGVLATGGTVSHRSSIWLLGMWTRPPAAVELTLGRPLGWRSDLVVHRLVDLEPSDATTVNGIPCTNAARVLVDLGGVCTPSTVEKVFHQVQRERRATFDEVVAAFFRVARRGRSGCGVLRAILERYEPAIAPCDSDLEVVMVQVLRRHGVPDPVRQHPVTVAGRNFFLDLAYPGPKIFLEGDGFGVHTERHAFENDRERQNLLVLAGWLPLRFTWRMLIHQPSQVAATVLRAHDHRVLGSPTVAERR